MREAQIVMIAAFAALGFGGTAELTAPDHECGIQQSTLLEIFE